MDAYWRLEKQTDGAGRKSVVSLSEYRGDGGRRGGGGGQWGLLLMGVGGVGACGGDGGPRALGTPTREKTYEINFSLSLSPLVFSPPPPYFPLCHLREVSQCCGGTQPCSHY